jgi:tetratricopeptide (TPR) repeat protein
VAHQLVQKETHVIQFESEVFGHSATLLLPANSGADAISATDLLQTAESRGAKAWLLRCDFDEGGPWAGVRDFFRANLDAIRSEAPHLLTRHDYELVYVLPELKRELHVRNPTLTDVSTGEERVRNYPADRAFRIVQGLIELTLSFKESSRQTAASWLLICIDYDRASYMGRLFFQELMRRAGTKLNLSLLALSSGGDIDASDFRRSRTLSFAVTSPPHLAASLGSEETVAMAENLEREVGEDEVARMSNLPDLIYLWNRAGKPDKVLYWKYRALKAFNTLGVYSDAISYGESAREIAKDIGQYDGQGPWAIFFKLFICYLTTNAIEKAQRLAEEDVLMDRGDPSEFAMRIRLCYLMSMLYARYRPERDLATGERYLEEGLSYLAKANLPDHEHCFQYVFNRNGLAMIRCFQGRQQEALDICKEGYRLLESRLSPDQHRLHRSVLLYNLAQVYTQLGLQGDAVGYYKAAMEMDPNYSEYYNERGNLFLKMMMLEEAERDYRRAIDLSPPYHEVWYNLGQCLRLMGRMEEALESYAYALELMPAQAAAHLGRAQALEAIGRLEEAATEYTATLEIDSSLWQAYAGRAVLSYELGRIERSLEDLDRAVGLAPNETELYQNRAVALSDLERYDEARRDLEHYLRLRPDASDREEIERRLASLDGVGAVNRCS